MNNIILWIVFLLPPAILILLHLYFLKVRKKAPMIAYILSGLSSLAIFMISLAILSYITDNPTIYLILLAFVGVSVVMIMVGLIMFAFKRADK